MTKRTEAPSAQSAAPLLLQLGRLPADVDGRLAEIFTLQRLFECEDPASWLALHGAEVRAVTTDGGLGVAPDLVKRLDHLGIIAVYGVGVDRIDLDLVRSRGVVVATTQGVLTDDVADLAVGLTIALLRRLPANDLFVRENQWPKGRYGLGRRTSGRRFGIVGLGRVGEAIAARLTAFGPVAYTGPRPKSAPYAFVADLVDLADQSDVLVIACSANASNAKIINAGVLRALGADGVLVNVARGSLVDEAALIGALKSGEIAGAALDVFEHEPDVAVELRSMTNVVLTPHIGSATVETRAAMGELMLRNLAAFLKGERPPAALG